MNVDGVQLVAVDTEHRREAARALIHEYLDGINATALQNYGLSFDIDAMVSSDVDDTSKFYPPTGRFYLVSHDNAYVGVGCLKRLGPATGEIQRMFVQGRARGLGAGRLLVERLIADARELGYTTLRLESLKALETAHALYRSVGFVEIYPYADNSMNDYQAPETVDTYRSSAVFMELRL